MEGEPDPACACGEGNETWEHVLFRCSLYDGLPMQLTEKVGAVWLLDFKVLITTRESFCALRSFMEGVFILLG